MAGVAQADRVVLTPASARYPIRESTMYDIVWDPCTLPEGCAKVSLSHTRRGCAAPAASRQATDQWRTQDAQ
eukprot:5217783-Pyramimonas_sp.AAC.2